MKSIQRHARNNLEKHIMHERKVIYNSLLICFGIVTFKLSTHNFKWIANDDLQIVVIKEEDSFYSADFSFFLQEEPFVYVLIYVF